MTLEYLKLVNNTINYSSIGPHKNLNFQGGAFGPGRNINANRPLKAWNMPEEQGHCSTLPNPCLKYPTNPTPCMGGAGGAWGGGCGI